MWLWIIIGAVVCCVVAAIAQGAEDAEKSAEEKENKKVRAKRPDAFIRLFSEEFPDFSIHITFAKAEAALHAWETAIESDDFKRNLKLFNKGEFKDRDSAHKAMRFAASSVAGEISPEFTRYVQKNPEIAYAAIRRAIVSSITLANQ